MAGARSVSPSQPSDQIRKFSEATNHGPAPSFPTLAYGNDILSRVSPILIVSGTGSGELRTKLVADLILNWR